MRTGRTAGPYPDLLRRYFLPQWPWALALVALLAATVAVQLVQPLLMARFIDGARGGQQLTRIALAVLGLAVTGQIVGFVDAYLSTQVALVTTNRLRRDLALHCLRLDRRFHADHLPGELISRIDSDVAALANFLSRMIVVVLGNAALLAGILVLVLRIDWRLGLILAGCSGLVVAVLYLLRDLSRPAWEQVMVAQADTAGYFEERLSATEDIRSSGAVGHVIGGMLQLLRRTVRAYVRAIVVGTVSSDITEILFAVGTGATLWLGAVLFRGNEVTIGTVFLLFTYARLISEPLQVLSRQVQEFQQARAAIGRISALLSERSVIEDGPGAALPEGALSVAFEDVSFQYVPDEPVLLDVSLTLNPGRVLGLMGRTGAGKSTLARLLLRFADPQSGTVRIGGVDVRIPTLHELRARIGYVTQHVQLFAATVRDNLAFYDPSITDELLRAALTHVGLDLDLDREIAPGGSDLSAGEAQLLAFARVFLRRPGLVILDEATSRLDPSTEARIERATAALLEGRTAIVIAHRLTTLQRVDDVCVVEDGRVVEYGPRATLAGDERSRYAQLLRLGEVTG